jgi:hypothetical protein
MTSTRCGSPTRSRGSSFCNALLPTFDQQQVNSHPVSNWLVLILALATSMPASDVPYDNLIGAADQMYRICWITQQLGNVQTLITSAQATAVLTQYNLQF